MPWLYRLAAFAADMLSPRVRSVSTQEGEKAALKGEQGAEDQPDALS